jgi:hypothetical protein
MADKPVAILVSGGGGAPRIPPRQVGKPGVREVADMCTGPEYAYLKGMRDQATIQQGHNPKPSKKKVAAAFAEVMHNEPSTVARADVSEARKQKMRVAIALSKARRG